MGAGSLWQLVGRPEDSWYLSCGINAKWKDTNMPSEANWHYLEWDEAKVCRFWDFAVSWSPWQGEYFSKQVGVGVVNFLRYLVPLDGRTLDYGCGPGHLIESLLDSGVRCEAIDFSPETVAIANKRFSGNPLWGGAKACSGSSLPFPDNTFDLIICVETIEHLLPAQIDTTFRELRRILKPGVGKLFITTPNSEDLEKNYVYCAECGAVMHRRQHLRCFTRATLVELLHDCGLRPVLCDVTAFHYFQQSLLPGFLDWSPRDVIRVVRWAGAWALDSVGAPGAPLGGRRFRQLIGSGYHLFWFGEREHERDVPDDRPR